MISAAQRVWLARAIAMLADAVQIVVFPVFFEGFLSPANAALDVAVAIAMIVLVGWHIAFLPSFLVELVPLVDLVPTWTLAVMIATRGASKNPPMLTTESEGTGKAV